MSTPSDRLDRLMAEWRAGNPAAYRIFLTEAARILHGFLDRRLESSADAEDLVQECLIAMHEKRATLDADRPVGPWMFAIARYKLADHWRRHERAPVAVDEPPEIPVPADNLAGRDVAVLLGKLPPDQAQAIRMTKIEGLTGPEAARRSGIGLSALKLRVHRGMAKMRRQVGNGNDGH